MKRMHLCGFKIAGAGHTAIGLWRHPRSQVHRYKDLDYWLETARTLERGMFDAVFLADFLGLADTYGGSADVAFRESIQVPINDPLGAISAMAAVTRHLGFGVTVSTTLEQPYSLARRLTTLDHLTKGRMGWNIVTSFQDSAARNLGMKTLLMHDERYDLADEFMSVMYKLWEGSWEDDAVRLDRQANVFADPGRIHPAAHAGRYFQVPDAFLCEPSPQRTPVLFQAGASSRGQEFGTRHAEAIFLVETRTEALAAKVKEGRAAAANAGRDPNSVKFLAGISVITAETDALAQEKFEEILSYISEEGTLARQSALGGVDLAVDLDKPLKFVENNGIRSWMERFTKGDPGRTWTPREIAREIARSPGGVSMVGSPATVADQMEELIDKTDLDGFNVYDHMPLETFPEFVELVVPELQRRGRLRTSYEGSTLRENLLGAGHTQLASDHPGRSYRAVPAARV